MHLRRRELWWQSRLENLLLRLHARLIQLLHVGVVCLLKTYTAFVIGGGRHAAQSAALSLILIRIPQSRGPSHHHVFGQLVLSCSEKASFRVLQVFRRAVWNVLQRRLSEFWAYR